MERSTVSFSWVTIDELDYYALQEIFPRKSLPELLELECRDESAPPSQAVFCPVVEIGNEASGYRVQKLRIPRFEDVLGICFETITKADGEWAGLGIAKLDALETLHLDWYLLFGGYFFGEDEYEEITGSDNNHWIGRLKSLKEFVLCRTERNNYFSSYIPPAIGRMTRLEKLQIRDPDLGDLRWLPASVFDLTSLKELEISNVYFFPEGIRRLTNLEILRLPFSRMQSIPAALQDLPKLKCLDLSHSRGVGRFCIPRGIEETVLRNQAQQVLGLIGSRVLTQEFPVSLWPLFLNQADRLFLPANKFDDFTGIVQLPQPDLLFLLMVQKGARDIFQSHRGRWSDSSS